MPIYELEGKIPKIHPDVAFISPHAIIIGDVSIQEGSSILDNVVIEADVASITIGARVVIQSQSVVHTLEDSPTRISDNVTVGHRAVVHGAFIEDTATIGIGAIVASYARVGRCSIIGEGALVPNNMVIPPFSLAMGVPAKVVKKLGPEYEAEAGVVTEHYMKQGLRRAALLRRIDL